MPENVQNEQQILTAKQEALITALLAGNNVTVSAAAIGVNEKTVRRWLKLPYVQAAQKAAQKQVFEESLSLLMTYADDALNVLRSLMKDQDTPASARIRAAQIVLEQSIEIHKMNELEQKYAELEALVKQLQTR